MTERISDAELAVMEVLWHEAPLTALEVVERIDPERGWSDRTVKTMLGRLLTKGVIANEEEAKAILGFLFAHLTQERFIYRHKWREQMLLMWDNRCTMHFAEGGYDGHLRLMHRTTVAGDLPV